jgi:hypothetical protein
MNSIFKKIWPPTKTYALSISWVLGFAAILQWALPEILMALGSKGEALLAIYPGLLLIIWAARLARKDTPLCSQSIR